ncbi:ATP-binding cassette domain-containing protein [Xenophilus sp. Marseille-Q4582]|uniref:phosphatase domain-containing putative toxin n=1 Tax=Xenophilus sp. Marseille-Q4582 TaxID=2866600 RepID=UPI001CE3F760|nr:ATP-binding cassette domain-containing protein [Xenophilus sp. Marseille-Q4582]
MPLPPDSVTATATSRAECLSTHGFGVAFGDKVILAEVHATLRPHAITALLGPTGTGKSTLLRSLAGLNDQNPRYRRWGEVEYMGRPLAPAHRPALVQQHVQLMQAPTLEALSGVLRMQSSHSPVELREWARDWVGDAGFPELAEHFTTPTIDLPPLLQRVVAILREAAGEPRLLMIDEPTFGLPDYEAYLLLQMLEHLRNRCALLLVLHNQKQVRRVADDVLMLAGGRVQEAASAERFFSAPESEAGRQFLATGSCALPAPDAKPQELAEDAPLPPPLPTLAQLALQSAPESMGPRGFIWVVPGKLAGTPMPGVVHGIDYDLAALKAVGVTCLITLTENDLPQDALARHGLRNVHLPIRDREPPTVAQTTMLLMRMDTLLRRGEVLAAHCLAGLGRTGTLLAAWLVREGLTAPEALRRVRRIEPQFVQSREQEEFLQRYEDNLLARLS